jgi:hypothetical protein
MVHEPGKNHHEKMLPAAVSICSTMAKVHFFLLRMTCPESGVCNVSSAI